MEIQALVNVNNVDRWSFEDVVEKRAFSRILLTMLLEESNYKLASELEAGATDVFQAYARQIEELNIRARKNSKFVADLKSLLVTCRAEISYQQKWSKRVLASLPDDQDAQVLIVAFATANGAAASLLQIVEQYQEAHVHAVL